MKSEINYSISELKAGDEFDLGEVKLSEQEIIDFAKAFDPLDFHTDKAAAEKSYFKRLIASGPHIFTLVHKKEWIPRFGKTVIAGIEVNKWRFLKPVYPEMPVFSKAKILEIKTNREKNVSAVLWKYEFTDINTEMVQSLEMLVLHKLN
jgi:acyl dehydratase